MKINLVKTTWDTLERDVNSLQMVKIERTIYKNVYINTYYINVIHYVKYI